MLSLSLDLIYSYKCIYIYIYMYVVACGLTILSYIRSVHPPPLCHHFSANFPLNALFAPRIKIFVHRSLWKIESLEWFGLFSEKYGNMDLMMYLKMRPDTIIFQIHVIRPIQKKTNLSWELKLFWSFKEISWWWWTIKWSIILQQCLEMDDSDTNKCTAVTSSKL